MTFDDRHQEDVKKEFYNAAPLCEREPIAKVALSKSLQILKLLSQSGYRRMVYTVDVEQSALARELHITRQALSSHFKKLRESGLVQIGRGFVNVTEDGLKILGYRKDPAIVIVRILPQNRAEAIEKIKALPAIEIFRVAGDADAVVIVEQDKLDHVLGMLAGIDGIVDTKSLVSIVFPRTTSIGSETVDPSDSHGMRVCV